jgi:sugar lactone lactonase YvrE
MRGVGVRVGTLSLMVLVACCIVGLVGSPAVVLGEGAPSALGSDSSSTLMGSPLVVPGVQSLDEGQQAGNAVEAKLSNPEAVAEREASETKFEGLNGAQAEQLASEVFPAVVDRSDGGPPQLPAGQKAEGFASPDVEQVDLGGGEGGIIESSVPMATKTSSGAYAPVDLGLHDAGGAFEPANPLVAVRIPKHLGEGARLPAGVSLTPVDSQGASLGGVEGASDGATIDFANTQTDTDTILKPSSFGVDVDALLRSVESPEDLYYKIGMPQGAKLVELGDGSGGVQIIREGVAIAQIAAPAAHDAAGTEVPVSMSVSGDVLVVAVHHRARSYQYPIFADPEFWEVWSNIYPGNWNFHEWIGYKYASSSARLEMRHEEGWFSTGDYGEWSEQTQGYTKIYEIYIKDMFWPLREGATEGEFRAWLEIFKHVSEEHKTEGGEYELHELVLSGSPYATEATVCANPSCSSSGGMSNNAARFGITTVESSQYLQEHGLYPDPSFGAEVSQASTAISQEKGEHSTVRYNTSSTELSTSPSELNNTVNVLDGSGAWIGPHSGAFEFTAEDGGLGVQQTKVEYHGLSGWETYAETNFQSKPACIGVQCDPTEHETYTYESLTHKGEKPLPEPEAKVRVEAGSVMPYSRSSEHGEGETTLKVDTKSPHSIVLSGLSGKSDELELGEVEGHIRVEASDGEGTIPSSGIKWIGLEIDGHTIGKSAGYCSPGPCASSNEWSLNGAELGTGDHTLTVSVLDNAGNIETKKYELNVYHATPVASGPGSVNPESGDFAMEATDVNLSGGMGSLEVTRHYDSRNPTEGEEGPLGPQWTIGLSSLAGLEVLPDKSVMVIGSDGLTHFAINAEEKFEAPEGDTNLTLEYESKTSTYLLRNPTQGTTIEFTYPKGAKLWMPTVSKDAVATDTTTDEYKTVEISGKTIVEPTLELAPHPSAACAHQELEKLEIAAKGCRAIEFHYYEETTAKNGVEKGEAESEWGGYKNRLKEVLIVAYNPSAKAMVRTAVAKYEYDQLGRLRVEWNPEISPALRTIYGYDLEGHVTAVASSGQQPWLVHYGAMPGDLNKGRLLSTIRPSAATALWNGKALVNTTVPTLSNTSPAIGTTLSVSSKGTWNNGPLAYSYQWEDCKKGEGHSGEGEVVCMPIVGAVNQSYTPQASDAGYMLVARVTAENTDGAQTAATAASMAVPMPAASFSSAFGFGVSNGESKLETCTTTCKVGISGSGSGQFKEPNGVGVDKEGDVWVADKLNSRIEKFSSSGSLLGTYTPDSMLEPEAVAFDPVNGNIYVSNTGRNRIDELSMAGSLIKTFGATGSGYAQLNQPDAISFDSSGDVLVADTNNDRIEEFSSEGTYINRFGSAGSGNGQFTYPTGIAFCNSTLYVADWGDNRVEKFSSEGQYEGQFGKAGSGNGEFSNPSRIACEPTGNDLYVTDKGNNRVQEFTTTGIFISKFGSTGQGASQFSTPIGVAVGTAGAVYVVDGANYRIEKWTPTYSTTNPLPEPPSAGSISTTTVEYGIPVSGSGAPHEMGAKEVKTWAQKDDPEYATAIFPPDEPMGWPAKDYKRATISYMDNRARTVNVALPSEATSGAIATSEYNETNDVTRSLSADNRATALKENCVSESECKSATVSELLDTKNKYEEEGTQLAETRGPQHMVKIVSGKAGKSEETLARSQTHYYYNENAPEGTEGEVYDLATKIVSDALTTTGEEFDKRTSTMTYSGQNGLGWKLRKPTSTTTDPSGLDLTKTFEYNEATGNTTETKAPAGTKAGIFFSSVMGSGGEGSGHFNSPKGIVLDGKGDVVVADEENARVDIFKENGEFVKSFGSWGTEAGQFLEIRGVAVDSKGDIWTDDQGRADLQEFTEKGAYLKTVGSYGSGVGRFVEPKGITIDSHNNLLIADTGNNRIDKFNEKGEFVVAYGYGVSNGEEKLESCTSSCRAGNPGSGNGQLKNPRELTVSSTGEIWVTDTGNNRVEGFTESGVFIKTFGSSGTGPGQFKEPKGITIDAQGSFLVTDGENDRVEKFNTKGEYKTQFGSEGTENGQFHEPWAILVNSHNEIFVSDSGNDRIQKFTQSGSEVHDTKIIYYTAKGEATVAACQNHPEWVNLPCQTEPAEQPADGLNLPITTISYNMWNKPEVTVETFGSIKRTKKTTFDGAGRSLTSEEISSIGEPLPTVIDAYNKEKGGLETQSTTVAGKTRTITSKSNTLGQLVKYTDADGGTTIYSYEEGGDGRLEEIVMDGPEGEAEREKGKQTYSYNTTTGLMEKLVDSAAGTFTAGYDVEGKMTTETYPNGMTATYMISSAGQSTGLEYKKTTHCSTSCTWFNDNITPGIHGETLVQTSTLSKENYSYSPAQQLKEVQETPAGKPCTARLYGYDEESDRTSLTTRQSSNETCPVEGGTTEHHTYDEANHLIDAEVAYEAFGDRVKLPAADAGQYPLTSSFYVDDQVASQSQNEKTISYGYDPEDRTRETKTVIKGKAEPAVISHYSAPGGAVVWTSEEGKAWTRNIPAIDGTLSATHSSSGITELQLHDLKGNVVATASPSETETKLLKTYNSTEFGVPSEGKEPPKYAWLGADGLTSELPSGTVARDGITYVPLTGEPLQTQPVELPIPINVAPVFTDPQSAWIAETAGEASTRQVAAAEAERALGGASCNEDIEGCGADPEHGDDTAGCGVWVSWKHYLSNDLGVNGHFVCNYDVTFEIQIALLLVESNGHYKMVHFSKHTEPFILSMVQYHYSAGAWECTPGATYQAWTWGRYWNSSGRTVWDASAEDGHYEKCPAELVDVESPSNDS